MRLFLFVSAIALLSSTIAGCSNSSQNTAAPHVPERGDQNASVVSSVIGLAPDVSVFVRPQAARNDAYWGPLLGRVLTGRDHNDDFISHGSGMLVLNSQQIDMYLAVRDPFAKGDGKADPRSLAWMGVIHGLAPLDPLTIRTGGGRPMFAPPMRLPSGVLEYLPDQSYQREFGLFSPTLFVMPNGTAVVTEQVSAPGAHNFYWRSSAAPHPLQTSGESLGGIAIGVTSVRFLDAGKNDRTGVTQGMTSMGLGLHGGSKGAIDAYLDYATDDDAKRGYVALERSCAHEKNECLVDPRLFRDVSASRDDNRIAVKLSFSEAALRSLRDHEL